jgi:hypothetical protein
MQGVLNALEPERPETLPRDLWFECGGYRRRADRTRNAHVATLFGSIVLWRRGYRSWERTDKSIFPLEMLLGLTAGVTPGLADWLGREMAAAGGSNPVLQASGVRFGPCRPLVLHDVSGRFKSSRLGAKWRAAVVGGVDNR